MPPSPLGKAIFVCAQLTFDLHLLGQVASDRRVLLWQNIGVGIANAMTEGVRVFEIQVKLLQPRIARQLPHEGAKRLVSLRSRRR